MYCQELLGFFYVCVRFHRQSSFCLCHVFCGTENWVIDFWGVLSIPSKCVIFSFPLLLGIAGMLFFFFACTETWFISVFL